MVTVTAMDMVMEMATWRITQKSSKKRLDRIGGIVKSLKILRIGKFSFLPLLDT